MPTISMRIFSPRWGHEDTYDVHLEQDEMRVTMAPRVAVCTWRDNLDPVWSGESLDRIMRNDMIYAPAIFQRLLEHLWMSWRNSELTTEQANAELQELAEWLNATTRAKPRTDFWRAYF
jgi:hypothetical protein